MRICLELSVMRLYNGRRSAWGAITIGRWCWWVSRWDTARVKGGVGAWQWRRPEMTWYGGRRVEGAPR